MTCSDSTVAVVEFEVEIEGVDGLVAVRDRDGKLVIFSADVTGCMGWRPYPAPGKRESFLAHGRS